MTVKQTFISSAELNYPKVLPTLDLNFAHTRTLDPRITFTRSSGGSYVGADGLIKYAGVNEARFDHDPVTGESLGLLIEESRNNLLLRSEEFDNAYWTKTISSALKVTDTASLDGLQNAYLFRENASTGNDIHTIGSNDTYQSGFKYCFSVFAKAYGSGNRKLFMLFGKGAFPSQQAATFDLITGTVSGISTGNGTEARIEKYPNGWYRCTLIGATTISTKISTSILYLENENTVFYPGDGVSGVYIWGAQVEQGSFPTSYIPTQASTRTRAADNAVITGKNFSDFFNFYEGTSFVSFKFGPTTIDSRIFVCYGTPSYNTMIQRTTTGGQTHALSFTPPSPSGETFQFVGIPNTNTFTAPYLNSNSCFSYKSEDIAYSTSGFIQYTNNTKFLPLNNISRQTNEVKIGSATSSNYLNGWIKRFIYFPKRLPNEQLIALTR